MPDKSQLAIVMTGGGARAAYQVGVLRYIARAHPDVDIQLMTGVSAGAINAAYLAGRSTSFAEAVDGLAQLWSELRMHHVIRVGPFALLGNIIRWGLRLLSGGARFAPAPRSMVDTQPLREFLTDKLCTKAGSDEVGSIADNIEAGRLSALAVTTTSYTTGRSTTWVEGRDIAMWERPLRHSTHCRFTVEHIMASAALPLLFPAIRIEEQWHGDGGIRQMAPLSPALHLGAGRIFAITTRQTALPRGPTGPEATDYPPPARVAGILLNAIFLDAIDYDTINMRRINDVVRQLPRPDEHVTRTVDLLVMRPSEDLGEMAVEHERELPWSLRFLMRGWGTNRRQGSDTLAMLMFEGSYVRRLMDLGERDAAARGDEIAAFLAATPG